MGATWSSPPPPPPHRWLQDDLSLASFTLSPSFLLPFLPEAVWGTFPPALTGDWGAYLTLSGHQEKRQLPVEGAPGIFTFRAWFWGTEISHPASAQGTQTHRRSDRASRLHQGGCLPGPAPTLPSLQPPGDRSPESGGLCSKPSTGPQTESFFLLKPLPAAAPSPVPGAG